MNFYGPATHVGKIYRGAYQKPELLQPRYRTFGWGADFIKQDSNAFRNAPSFPKQECQEIKKVSLGFDCRCGVPNRKEQSPYHSPLGTLHTDGTGVFMPNMEAIVGGVPTEEREYPWQVGLKWTDDYPDCGGSILSSMTILTAAHCIDTWPYDTNLCVVVSQHDSFVGGGDHVVPVCYIHVHPGYNSDTWDEDFSILTLCSPITFHTYAQPICLPSLPSHFYESVEASTVSGWGSTSTIYGPYPDILMEVNVTTMSNSNCQSLYEPVDTDITDSMICAKADGKDSCVGDSGGPLVAQEPCGHYAQIGVVSWGADCADPFLPGVYARVTHRLEWIKSLMRGATCPPPSILKNM